MRDRSRVLWAGPGRGWAGPEGSSWDTCRKSRIIWEEGQEWVGVAVKTARETNRDRCEGVVWRCSRVGGRYGRWIWVEGDDWIWGTRLEAGTWMGTSVEVGQVRTQPRSGHTHLGDLGQATAVRHLGEREAG